MSPLRIFSHIPIVADEVLATARRTTDSSECHRHSDRRTACVNERKAPLHTVQQQQHPPPWLDTQRRGSPGAGCRHPSIACEAPICFERFTQHIAETCMRHNCGRLSTYIQVDDSDRRRRRKRPLHPTIKQGADRRCVSVHRQCGTDAYVWSLECMSGGLANVITVPARPRRYMQEPLLCRLPCPLSDRMNHLRRPPDDLQLIPLNPKPRYSGTLQHLDQLYRSTGRKQ